MGGDANLIVRPRLILAAFASVLAVFGCMLVAPPKSEAAQVTLAKSLTKSQIVAGGARAIKIECRALGRYNDKGVKCTWFSARLLAGTTTRNCKGDSELKPKATRISFKTQSCKTDNGATSLNALMPEKLRKEGLDSSYVFCFTTLGRGFQCVWLALRHSTSVVEDCKGNARSFNGATTIKVVRCARNPAASDAQAEVKRLLSVQGLTPGLVSCRAGAAVACTYEASWRSTGWTYSCTGTATAATPAGPFNVSRCDLSAPSLAPLTATPGPHPAFGVNDTWGAMPGELARLGRDFDADTARYAINWHNIQETPSSEFDFSYYDRVYGEAVAQGLKPVLIIMGAPCWATGAPACTEDDFTFAPDRQHLDDWREFAAAVTERYDEAMAIEVWNEANAEIFFHGGPQPNLYADLLKEAHAAIKAVDPAMPVITTGTAAFVDNNADQQRYDTFLRNVYQALGPNAADYSDAIGHHAYPGGGPTADIESGIRGQIADLKNVLLDFGDQDKDIWVTETGVSTTGRNPYTESQQAQAYSKIYQQFRRIPGVPVVITHRWQNQPGGVNDPETGFGLVRANGSKKPVYCALADARGKPQPGGACN